MFWLSELNQFFPEGSADVMRSLTVCRNISVRRPAVPHALPPPLRRNIASDRRELARLGITHILNCAQSKWRGGAEYYAGMNITYHGIEAHDSPTFDMSVNFYPAAEFIHKAMCSGGLCPRKPGTEPESKGPTRSGNRFTGERNLLSVDSAF